MNSYEIQKIVADDVREVIFDRYCILDTVSIHGPVGRRKLTEKLDLPERKVRNHLDYLDKKGLIQIDARGVTLTEKGKRLIPGLHTFILESNNNFDLEQQVKDVLGVKNVMIVPGNCDEDKDVVYRMGKKAADYILAVISGMKVLAITGGSAANAVAKGLEKCSLSNMTVIPVRGALGTSHSYQANSIAALVGKRLHCAYKQLNIPDNVDLEITQYLLNHPDIQNVTRYYDSIDVLVYGIGLAEKVAGYRMLDHGAIKELRLKKAAGEALGFYVDRDGKAVKRASGVGIGYEQLLRIPHKIAVSGGEKKADAIRGYCSFVRDVTLVTDEAAAKALLK